MGHLINPLSHRLGVSRFWNANWATLGKNSTYSYLAVQNVQLFDYLNTFFRRLTHRLFNREILLVNLKIISVFNQLMIVLELRWRRFINLSYLLNNLFYEIKYSNKKRRRRLLKKKRLMQKRLAYNLNLNKPKFNSKFSTFSLSVRSKKLIEQQLTISRPKKLLKKLNKKLINPRTRMYLHKKKIQSFFKKDIIFFNSKPMRSITNDFPTALGQQLNYSADLAVPDTNSLLVNNSMLLRLAFLNNGGKLKSASSWMSALLRATLLSTWLNYLQKFLTLSLKNFLFSKKTQIQLFFMFTPPSAISANFISQYISIRLLQKFPVRGVVRSVIKQLRELQIRAKIIGFKIECNGRFERRGRASHIWKSKGKVTRGTMNLDVDYAMVLPVLVNSVCAVRVWLTHLQQPSKLLII